MARYAEGRRKGIGGGHNKSAPTKVVRLPVPIANRALRLATSLRRGDVAEFLDIEARTDSSIPLYGARVPCGFPSAADDYLEKPLDFNELLIQNPAATYAVRVSGESMTGAGIYPGDIVIVDKSITPSHGAIVIALIEGEFTIKRYCLVGGRIVLQAENPNFANVEIPEETGLEVWGVITNSIRDHHKRL
jgi:DNA polymerase V